MDSNAREAFQLLLALGLALHYVEHGLLKMGAPSKPMSPKDL
jgi:hypothetical protein